jgi:hypothetical protein
MAIEAIKGAGMVYQGSTSTAQIKEQAQGRTEVSSADNQVVSDSIARNIQAMNTKEISVNAPEIIDLAAERYGNNQNPANRYNVTTVITVTSDKVDLIRGLISEQGELLKRGIAITSGE